MKQSLRRTIVLCGAHHPFRRMLVIEKPNTCWLRVQVLVLLGGLPLVEAFGLVSLRALLVYVPWPHPTAALLLAHALLLTAAQTLISLIQLVCSSCCVSRKHSSSESEGSEESIPFVRNRRWIHFVDGTLQALHYLLLFTAAASSDGYILVVMINSFIPLHFLISLFIEQIRRLYSFRQVLGVFLVLIALILASWAGTQVSRSYRVPLCLYFLAGIPSAIQKLMHRNLVSSAKAIPPARSSMSSILYVLNTIFFGSIYIVIVQPLIELISAFKMLHSQVSCLLGLSLFSHPECGVTSRGMYTLVLLTVLNQVFSLRANDLASRVYSSSTVLISALRSWEVICSCSMPLAFLVFSLGIPGLYPSQYIGHNASFSLLLSSLIVTWLGVIVWAHRNPTLKRDTTLERFTQRWSLTEEDVKNMQESLIAI